MTSIDLTTLTVGELLDTYSGILDELRRRGLVRTKNAPVGDLAEYAAAIAYGGTLENNSAKSYDLIAEDGRRVQVKVRNVAADTSSSQTFSAIRSDGYDVCLFILVAENRVSAAREWSPAEVAEHGKYRERSNSVAVRVGQLWKAGVDVTPSLQNAWITMLSMLPAVGFGTPEQEVQDRVDAVAALLAP
ncbi:DUF6998 domain-containing protein [Leifsonia sp. Leaf264]|uniref:DUF6998 domain-containing protein n=1 Tax=Leifsonia sp. Leaf264 TaxID=1736314 RepID=UPI0006FB0627|nr:hypothetical protein [Leifsonia sp. Leaf264]KQO98506.1 hypothetical protein ASF30_10615 [Leifsonia sp. Leaf264]